jgi:transposase-like protein
MNTTLNDKSRRRPRRSKDEIEALLAEYRESGHNCRAFAKKAGIEVGSLYSWLRVRDEKTKATGFAAVQLTGPGLTMAKGAVILKAQAGWHLEIAGELGSEFAAKLIQALMPCLR